MFIDDKARLHHMLNAAREAVEFVENKSRSEIDTNKMLTLAICRCFEIIGEAASRITKERQRELTQIPWSTVISMRNRIIHDYFNIDLDILWDTTTQNLPQLIAELETIIAADCEE
ncbi:MAG: DUF86 domain-containing protein [Myxacorys chilensis ATA2-1-KO14]|jgi:uncharacterized protein with HEPN domain|nr:DUF86 domain-containing protein [Myxacorys chilensis ATA2-1-KO14]